MKRLFVILATTVALSFLAAWGGTVYDPILGKLRSDVAATLPDGSAISAGGGNTASATVTAETSYGAASSAGTAESYSRGDHTHGTPAAGVALTGNETVAGVKTFSSSPIVPTPTADTQAANKVYVDTVAAGLSVRESVVAATTTALTLASDLENGDTLDTSVTLATGNRVLVKDQASGEENGIYVVKASGAPDRATDYDTAGEAAKGTFTAVLGGATNGNTQWVNATQGTIELGTTPLVFSRLSSSAGITAALGAEKMGNEIRADLKANEGLALSGNEIVVDYDNTTVGIVSNKLAVKAGGLTEANLATVATGILDDAGRVSGAALTALNSTPTATQFPAAALGTGTTDATTYLAGDGTWKTASVGVGTGTITQTIDLRPNTATPYACTPSTTGTNVTGGLAATAQKADLSNATHFRFRVNASKGNVAMPNVTFKVYYSSAASLPSAVMTNWTLLEKAGDTTANLALEGATTAVKNLYSNSAEIAAGGKTTVWLAVFAFAASSNSYSLGTYSAVIELLQGVTRTGVYRTTWVDAGAMIGRTTNGAATATIQASTNKEMSDLFDFDKDADEFVCFRLPMPDEWDRGNVKVKFFWTAASGTGTVKWMAQAIALSNDDAIDTAYGTAVGVEDTLITAGDVHVTSATSSITVGGTPALGDVIYWQVYRDVSEDTLDADARLLGVQIQYKETATEASVW